MDTKSEFISPPETIQREAGISTAGMNRPTNLRSLIEIGIVFVLILIAVWTPPGCTQTYLSVIATVVVVAIAVRGKFGADEMGLTRPYSGFTYILFAGALACGAIALIGLPLKSFGLGYYVSPSRSWQYAVWALEQEFILQSIFYIRLEKMLGSKQAVIAAALLFALVHIPSAVLTLLALMGGVLFCELFRRWRNLYPLGIIHAALGLTIAASLPDRWLHHMRVGAGYLIFRGH